MGVSPGEESRADSVAAQTIEAQPVFGQIEPSQRPRASRAEPQVSGEEWRPSVPLHKRSKRFGVEKETKEGERRYRQHKANRETNGSCRRIYVQPGAITAMLIEVLRGKRLSLAQAR